MHRSRTPDLSTVALSVLLAPFGAFAAEDRARAPDVLERVQARHLELVKPSLDEVFAARADTELRTAAAAERARLEQLEQDEPDARVEVTLVMAEPLGRDSLLGLQSALGAHVTQLTSRVRGSNGLAYTNRLMLSGHRETWLQSWTSWRPAGRSSPRGRARA